jgi:PAS domain S-box-containing protein
MGETVSKRIGLLPASPLHLVWVIPACTLGLGAIVRFAGGEPVSLAFFLGGGGIGVLAGSAGAWIAGRVERILKDELRTRSRELKASRDFLVNLVDSIPGVVLIVENDGPVIYASPAVEELLKVGRSDIVGRSAGLVFTGGTHEFEAILKRLQEQGGVLHDHISEVLPAEGPPAPVEISARQLADVGKNKGGVLLVLHDITERLTREKREVDGERLRILGECVAGVAHELNNPLTGVIGYLQLAGEERLPIHLEETLSKAGREAARMAQTIRTLLGFVRHREPERIPTDLNALVEQVCEFLDHQLAVNDIDLVLELTDLTPAMADPHLLRQVMLNLLKNAQDAIREAGRAGKITVRTRRRDNAFLIEVLDDGPGVPAELADRIFEHFFTTKPSGRGTGLGLPICRKILEDHGGELRLSSDLERGAGFELSLPVPEGEPIVKLEAPAPPAPAGLNVLVIDDEKGVREYLALVLETEGHTVRMAANGRQGLELFEAEVPDLVFLDMKMPDIPGRVCRERMIESRPEMAGRIVMMSGDRIAENNDELFLGKPMSPEEILEQAARAMLAPGVS